MPKNERGSALFDALFNRRSLPGAVEVVIFKGTAYERRFKLPASLNPQQIADWIRQVEALLSP